jgi:NADH:ubiquinone reductase (H+-translocating)
MTPSRPDDTTSAPRPRVVIVGGGFAGLSAAQALAGAPVDVTLLDRTNHYLFQPLLYQVATGVLSAADIAVPIRTLLRRQVNVRVVLAQVETIDLESRTVIADEGAQRFAYDFLIVATGARHSYFGHPDWESVAPGLKTLDDAREIRNRFLLAFEEAEKSTDPVEQDALLTFVVIGGGPTGVELAGMLPTIARKGIRREFRRIDPAGVRVILLEGGPRLLPAFSEDLSARACRDLERLGVRCRTGAMVTRVTRDAVYVGEERIAARTIFWAAGNEASPIVAAMGAPVDRAGRAIVRTDLSLTDHPEVFVAGDAAAAVMIRGRAPVDTPQAGDPPYVPAVAAAANQMGTHAATTILRTLRGQPREPFRYRHKGTMAVIGRGKALADFGRVRLTGMPAWIVWLFVHLLYLAGFRNRLSVLLEWAYAYVTYRPGARLVSVWDRAGTAQAAREAEEEKVGRPG